MVGSAADVDACPRRLDNLIGRGSCGRRFVFVLPGDDVRQRAHADLIDEPCKFHVSRTWLTTAGCGFALEVIDL